MLCNKLVFGLLLLISGSTALFSFCAEEGMRNVNKVLIPSLKDQNLVPLISELTGSVLIKPKLIATFLNFSGCMKAIRFNKESSKVIGISKNGTLKIWDIKKRRRLREFSSRLHYSDAAFADDGESILTKINDQTYMEWKKKDGRYCQSKRVSGCIPEIVPNPFITLCYKEKDNAVHFVDKDTGQCKMILSAHYKEVEIAQFNDDFSLLVTAGCDQKVHVWRVGKTPKEIMDEVPLSCKIRNFFCHIFS